MTETKTESHHKDSWLDRLTGWSKWNCTKMEFGGKPAGQICVRVLQKRWYHWWMDAHIYECPKLVYGHKCAYYIMPGTLKQWLHAKLFGYFPPEENIKHTCWY